MSDRRPSIPLDEVVRQLLKNPDVRRGHEEQHTKMQRQRTFTPQSVVLTAGAPRVAPVEVSTTPALKR